MNSLFGQNNQSLPNFAPARTGPGAGSSSGRRLAMQQRNWGRGNDPTGFNVKGVDPSIVANWFAAQDPKIQMAIAAGRGLEAPLQTPWGTIGTGWNTIWNNAGGASRDIMQKVRGTSGDWNNAGAQLMNYASYSNPDLWPLLGMPAGAGGQTGQAALKGIMNFTPGGGSFGPSAWDQWNPGKPGPVDGTVPYTGTNLAAASYLPVPSGASNPSGNGTGTNYPGASTNTNPRYNPGAAYGTPNPAITQLANGVGGSWNPYILPYIAPGQTGDTPGSYNYQQGGAVPNSQGQPIADNFPSINMYPGGTPNFNERTGINRSPDGWKTNHQYFPNPTNSGLIGMG